MCLSLWGLVPNREIPQVIRRILTTQQAFPKSAILTLMLSALSGSRGLTSRDPAVGLPTTEQNERQGEKEESTDEKSHHQYKVCPAEPLLHWAAAVILCCVITWCISFGCLTISQVPLRCVATVISILPLLLVPALLQLALLQPRGKEPPGATTGLRTAFLSLSGQLLDISGAVADWVDGRLIVPLLLGGLCVAIVLVFVPPLGGTLVRCMAVTVQLRWFFWSRAFDICNLTGFWKTDDISLKISTQHTRSLN